MRIPAASLLLVLVGCAPPSIRECASCASAKSTNGWCEGCNLGHVASVPIRSRMLFDTMDAHGHDLNLDSITCVSCKEAIERGGFCEPCRIGWHRKHAYFSRLTYELAKGTARNLSDLRCAVCRKNGSRHGWCEACGVGMLGRFAVRSREDYDRAAWELDRLIKASREAERCEYCAAAMVTDTGCITCRIAYKGGEKIDYPSRK